MESQTYSLMLARAADPRSHERHALQRAVSAFDGESLVVGGDSALRGIARDRGSSVTASTGTASAVSLGDALAFQPWEHPTCCANVESLAQSLFRSQFAWWPGLSLDAFGSRVGCAYGCAVGAQIVPRTLQRDTHYMGHTGATGTTCPWGAAFTPLASVCVVGEERVHPEVH